MDSGLAIAAYWEATFRGHLAESEKVVFRSVLAGIDYGDGRAVIDNIAAVGGFPPTAQRIAELADEERKERLRLTAEAPYVFPHRPYVSFADWIRDHATDDERRSIAKTSPNLAAKLGIEIEGMA